MKDKNLPVLFLHKNKKRGDLVGNGMGLGLVSTLRFTPALSKTKG